MSPRRLVSFLMSQYVLLVTVKRHEMRYLPLGSLSLNAASAHFCIYVMQLPTSMKGGNGKVAYIDTEGTLYP